MQFLVDCGMQQGEAAENGGFFAFQPSEIAYLFLTHAHIDHCGLIPKLVKEGFKGKIITTPATADLARIMLHDSAHIQEKDAEWKTKKALRQGRDQVFEPLYTTKDVDDAMPRKNPHIGEESPVPEQSCQPPLPSGSISTDTPTAT